MTCINCGNEVSENFCSSCGQRTSVKRITFKESWFDFWSRIYGFDGMFPRTIHDLTVKPGNAAQLYISGNRVLHYGPVGYFFLMVTLYLLIMSIVDVNVVDFMRENQRILVPQPNPGSGQEKFNKMVLEAVAENLRLIAFIVIPFNALSAKYIFFRKSGLNFLEHCVLPLYVIGHGYWINIFSVFVYKFSGSLIVNNMIFGILLLYFGYAYSNMFSSNSKWKNFIKGIGVCVGGQFLMVAVAIIIVSLVIVSLKFINPDALELIKPSNSQ